MDLEQELGREQTRSSNQWGIRCSLSMDDTTAAKRFAVASPQAADKQSGGLSSSFDLSLLNTENRDTQQFTPSFFRYSASWDDGELPKIATCKRTKLAGPNNYESELPPAGIVRKPASRSAVEDSTQIPGTPSAAIRSRQAGSCIKKTAGKLTPVSAKRRRAASHLRKSSPLRRVPPLTPRSSFAVGGFPGPVPATNLHSKPLSSFGRLLESSDGIVLPSGAKRRPKISLGTTATSASTVLDTTTDTFDSMETLESSTPFRFNSFPASLPRINTSKTKEEPGCPVTVRKRMSFADKNQVYYPRDDDTHNTSVSSIQDEGNYANSEDEEKRSPVRTPVARARLNFLQAQSPSRESPSGELDLQSTGEWRWRCCCSSHSIHTLT